QQNPPIRKLQRIVMHVRLLRVDLAETSDIVAELAQAEPWNETAERMLVLGFLLEYYLRTGEKADRHLRFVRGGKAARAGAGKTGGDQLLAHFGRAGCDSVQTIVTHGSPPQHRIETRYPR